jgi:hypothetical protein
MHPRRAWWGFVFLVGCGSRVAESGGAKEPPLAASQAASPAEAGARYLPETAGDVLFVNRERLRQTLLGERLVKWSELRSILPQDVPFASLEDWETRLLQNSDWFYIAADPRSVGMLVAKADRATLEAEPALGVVRAGMAWPHADVCAVDYSQLKSPPRLEPRADHLELTELTRKAVVAFVHHEPDTSSPIEAYRFSIGTDYGLNVEVALALRPGVDSAAVSANLEAKLSEAAASPMVPLFRVRTLLDHAVVRAAPSSVTVSTSLSDVETKNLIQLLDMTHDELRAAGTLEAWARGIGERAAFTQVFFQPAPAPRASGSTGSSPAARRGQASKLASFTRGLGPGASSGAPPEEDYQLKQMRKKLEDDRKKAEAQRQRVLEEQTEYYKNKNEEFRRTQEPR